MASGTVTRLRARNANPHATVTHIRAQAAGAHATVTRIRATAIWAPTLEPRETVTLPPGTWTQAAGPTVTVTDGQFVAPATVNGASIVLTDGAASLTYQVLPHTFWMASSGKIVALHP